MKVSYFAAYANASRIATVSAEIDRRAARFGGAPVRHTPLHATVLMPREADDIKDGFNIATYLDRCAGGVDPVIAVASPLEVFKDLDGGPHRYLVVPVDGLSLRANLNRVLHGFYKEFGQQPLPYEGARPHVTLLSTKQVPDHVFDAVAQSVVSDPICVESPVIFTALNLYERKEGDEHYSVSYEALFRQPRAA